MQYLFILDYQHLDNGGFLKRFSRKIGSGNFGRFMIIHGDSAYTDRIMQTGVMREDARIRSVKELNHRLTALFADEGVPLIAMNAYQRDTITKAKDDSGWNVDADYLKHLGGQTNVLLSNLVGFEGKETRPLPLGELASLLHKNLQFEQIIAFDAVESFDEIFTGEPDSALKNKPETPEELKNTDIPVKLMRLKDFEKNGIAAG